ncbi:copper amine oxidase N-terminal domain-containing protein [Paenibacillus pasadenensis]|uniref:copper amine oxidase N-terminal domain-containing protein n=1 Tax=Paenibacillus pasadenensis TaxID=217090 RepID=UPI00203A68D1|nr:copper amine oxidase N-terminal domain-containing protein [Paenibacillus pasadenensis]MCM3749946.1 copper amine oxidase N-terminal domain-containing protein [Paenibacillus pasadenensis]
MKKSAKALPALLSVAALSLAASSIIAASPASGPISTQPPTETPAPDDQQAQPNFASVSGTVKSITDSETQPGTKTVSLENDTGEVIANVSVTSNTYVESPDQLKVGAKLIVFYDAKKPMIMIYPPQFEAEVVVTADAGNTWKVDRFSSNAELKNGYLSEDNSLIILPSDKTKIITEDGKPFTGDLNGRALAVKYGVSTLSFPAQASPELIVVLFEEAVPAPGAEAPVDEAPGDVANHSIVVEGKTIEAPAAFTDEKGTVMVPLRAITEALNQKLKWESATKTAWIGITSSLQIGKDYYTYNKMAPIELGTAPELVNGSTYVPLSFFKDVLRLNNAYVLEDQIVIDNQEKMG